MSELTKFQNFEIKRIHRSQIKFADYNPNVNKGRTNQKLGTSIEAFGLVDTVVWNERTGNCVGGKHRIELIDKKGKTLDYLIDVAAIDVDETREKEINLALNNKKMQGETDLELLKNILLDDIDFKSAGYDNEDIELLNIDLDLTKTENLDIDRIVSEFETIKKQNKESVPDEERQARKEKIKEVKQNIRQQSNADKFVVFTFDNFENKASFMEYFKRDPDERYIKGEMFMEQLENGEF